ncbi:unnamed protein product [Protopolystoma xenopodis]|uniref:Uncharacterized protein n=1 Tax=Protopolystoma xenopodis TaxID=117903 RepID=A0A3S5CQI6_9PLAT|nr:unnamed protein product [Protopolystoma xenopodis]
MECPRGHRFFLAGPDRAMQGAMPSSQVRRAVRGLLEQHLPLYMLCRCSKPSTGLDRAPLGKLIFQGLG